MRKTKTSTKKKAPAKTHSVYVISLSSEVLEIKKFCEANPNYIPGKPCVYVGMTGRDPDTRFKQHKEGYKKNKYVQKYGLYLRRRLFEKYNPIVLVQPDLEFNRFLLVG